VNPIPVTVCKVKGTIAKGVPWSNTRVQKQQLRPEQLWWVIIIEKRNCTEMDRKSIAPAQNADGFFIEQR
jgi:hypothetical protein